MRHKNKKKKIKLIDIKKGDLFVYWSFREMKNYEICVALEDAFCRDDWTTDFTENNIELKYMIAIPRKGVSSKPLDKGRSDNAKFIKHSLSIIFYKSHIELL